jgi:mannosyltransferase
MNLRILFAKTLILVTLALSIVFLAIGVFAISSPAYFFNSIILPLANLFSTEGYIRQYATVEFLYKKWLSFGQYLFFIIGLPLLSLSFMWDIFESEKNGKIIPPPPGVDENKKSNNLFYVFYLILITFTGAILRCINLNTSFWIDEIVTVDFIKHLKLFHYEVLGNHWLYSLLGYFSIKGFGENEAVVRLPAFIFGIAIIPLIYYFMKNVLSKKEGLLAASLLCVASFHIQYSTEARGYTALAFISLLSSLLFFKIFFNKASSKIEILLFGLVTTFGWLTHLYYFWIFLAQYLTILTFFIMERVVRKKIVILNNYIGRRLITAMLIGSISAFAIYGPYVVKGLIKEYVGWAGRGDVISFKTIGELLTGNAVNTYGILFAILFLFGLLDLTKAKNEILVTYIAFLVLPLIIIKIMWGRVIVRYFMFLLPFLIIGIVHGIVVLAKRFNRPLRIVVLLVSILIFTAIQLPAFVSLYSHHKSGKQDYRSAGELIDKFAKQGDAVCAMGIGHHGVQYYIMRHKVKLFDKDKFYDLISSKDVTTWLVVTFSECLNAQPGAEAVFKVAKEKFKLVGYFSGGSDILVYRN